jgi:hypothetical protein
MDKVYIVYLCKNILGFVEWASKCIWRKAAPGWHANSGLFSGDFRSLNSALAICSSDHVIGSPAGLVLG